jgi:hypothetical protein
LCHYRQFAGWNACIPATSANAEDYDLTSLEPMAGC